MSVVHIVETETGEILRRLGPMSMALAVDVAIEAEKELLDGYHCELAADSSVDAPRRNRAKDRAKRAALVAVAGEAARPVPRKREPVPAPRKRDEATLEALLLRAVGRDPNVALFKNEVGQGYTANIRPIMRGSLAPYAFEKVDKILMTHRVTYGLRKGSPDLVGIVGGRFVGLELKTPTGRVSSEQQDWHERARRRGAAVEVVRSVEEGVAILEALLGRRIER